MNRETVGIVLAGGRATRLPNKQLLPLRNRSLVIESGIHYLRRSGLRVVVVVPPNSVLVDILSETYEGLGFAQQDEPLGVPDAVAVGAGLAAEMGARHVVAVCSDNVFPENEKIEVASAPACGQQVRACPAWKAMHLSRYDGHWQERGSEGSCVAGALVLPVDRAQSGRGKLHMTGFLRDCDATAWDGFGHEGWWDLGVADAYARYWRS